ncbi:putative outer membrane starch-binding protein [Chryseobacterium nakagawai]|nr:putative outer membrane starch-binding protein [Chryseobacterium nakagawai]
MRKNNIIKKGVSILSISLLMAIMNSCSDRETLDLQPYNNVDENLAFSTAGNVDLSIMGVYNAAQNGIYKTSPDALNTPRGYVFGAAYIEQNDMRGEDMVNTATFYQLTYTATYDGGSPNNVHYWMNAYGLINKANIAIEGLRKAGSSGVITGEVRDNYLGEMYFLRALAHLELLKHFSRPYNFTSGATHPGIPYRVTAITSPSTIDEALKVGRGTVAETYSKILADLDMAETLTGSSSTRAGNIKITRATKEAAIALKVRAYLNMRDWSKVLTEGAKLNSVYSLTASPSQPFILASNYNNSESIFSIENSANTNPGTNAGLASMYNNRSLVCISPIIWRNPRWLADDKRREETTMVRTASTGVKFVNKYKDVTNLSDGAPIIRYAEILLSMAEANARLGNAATAITQLNQVRNRSLATPATQEYTLASFTDATSLVDAIITERRIEFLGEGMRWGDIHRLLYDDLVPTPGIPAKMANGMPAGSAFALGTSYTGPLGVAMVPKTDFRILWPLPNDEVVNNPTLAAQQNPGW